MSSFHRCHKCDELVWTGKEECRCKPFTYQLKSREDPGEWLTGHFRAHDAEDAAEKIVEEDWQYEPGDPSKVDETVLFKDAQGNIVAYHVTAEATVNFSAKEVAAHEAPTP